jgi:hypothetical protein
MAAVERSFSCLPDDLEALTAVQWNELTNNLLDCDLDSLESLNNDLQDFDAHTPPFNPTASTSEAEPVIKVEADSTPATGAWNIDVKALVDNQQAGEVAAVEQGGDADEPGLDADVLGGAKACSINKARREKLRRERLNERFSELASLLNLKGANIDKLRVLSEAIHTLQRLLDETKSLKSTNQHLRVANTVTSEMAMSLLKVAGVEGEENFEAPRDATPPPTQTPPTAGQAAFASNAIGVATVTPSASPDRPEVADASAPPTKRAKLNSEWSAADSMPASPTTTSPTSQGPPWMPAQMAHKLAPPNGMMMPNGMANAWMMTPNGMWMPMLNAPMSMWMPPSAQDTSQDHLLRPPVA